MLRIDAHTHVSGDHRDSLQLLEELGIALLNISVAKDPQQQWRLIDDTYKLLSCTYPQRYGWCTSFDPFALDRPGYADDVIARLERDIQAGAVACKIWKNVGMEIQRSGGRYVLPDDEAYDPVYRYLQHERIPLLMHIAEPKACWQSLEHPSPHREYYRKYPEWHMHGRSDVMSHEALIQARDNVVERYPDLKVIGAHLGSLEYDLDELARRFRRYPNFAVDTSARTVDLCLHDTTRTREWFLEFTDRIIWGTDAVQRVAHSQADEQQRKGFINSYQQLCQANFAFFGGSGNMNYGPFATKGLDLPQDVLQRFYHDNACEWYPRFKAQLESACKMQEETE